MINTFKIYEELAPSMGEEPARRLTSVLGLIYEDLQNTVTKAEFNELRVTMQELAEAQQRTEQRMETLGLRVEELAEAQQRTEQRMETLGLRVEELAEAQQRTEQRMETLGLRMEELAQAQQRTEQRMEELAEAQQRTEQRMETLGMRMEELAEAQQRTEQRMEELAEAQKQTAYSLTQLSRTHDNTRTQIGGLARTVGYALENEAYRKLPALLERLYGLVVEQRLIRTWVNDEEINFYARARRQGEEVIIVGESVVRLDDASKLGQLWRKLKAVQEVENAPLVPLLVAHIAHPALIEQAESKGAIVVQSFEWD
jgi:DNA repair exonuclease SbcCD ATPase subunit